MTKKTYSVTEKAGHFVAGVRSPGKDHTLLLTPEQAEHALLAGELVEAAADSEPDPKPVQEPKLSPKPRLTGN